jgi:SAM-dependent methyltransferase
MRAFVRSIDQEISPGGWLLDAGAGECIYRHDFTHGKYVSIDFGKGDLHWDYGDLDIIGDLHYIPIAPNRIDAILCIQVLEHVADPGAVLKELHRILKPGGALYVTAPQGWCEHQPPHDYFRFTSFALRKLFKDAGFDITYIEPIGGYFRYIGARLQLADYFLFSKGKNTFLNLLQAPFRSLSKLFFRILIPLICLKLDVLDEHRHCTLGYRCKCTKPLEGIRN